MTDMTIRLKLRLIFAGLAGIFLLFGLLSLHRLSTLNGTITEMESNFLPAIIASNAMNTALSDYRAAQSLHALAQDQGEMKRIEADMALHISELGKARTTLKALIFAPEGEALLSTYDKDYEEYEQKSKLLVETSRNNDNDKSVELLVKTEPLFEHISTTLDQLVELKRQQAFDQAKESQTIFVRSQTMTILAGLLVLAFAAGCVVVLERTVARALQTLAQEVARVGEGDFAVTIQGRERGDEIGRIARAVGQTVAAIQGTVGGLNHLIAEARAGNLSERVDPQGFRGEFATLLTGANELVETLTRPLAEVAEVMQKLASGKLEGRITGLYEGELRALKANVNRSLDTLAALLGEVAATARRLAEADLRQGIEGSYQGSFAEVRANVNQALAQLRELATEASAGTQQSSVAAAQTAAAAAQVATSSARQIGVLNEITTAIQEVSGSVTAIASHAATGSTLAATASELAGRGRSELTALVAEVDRIASRHGRIDQITATITRIADKTQVLSINAGIEAARAGSEGRGFGVVAHQIGRLAEEAARAASDIGTIIAEASEGVKSSVTGVAQARTAMERIGSAVEQSGGAAQAIAAAIAQQSAAMQTISQRLDSLGEEGESNAGAAEEISATMEELSRIIHRTRAQVARFTLA
jgi:methyl-accepting chemotaxis protein